MVKSILQNIIIKNKVHNNYNYYSLNLQKIKLYNNFILKETCVGT